MSKIKFYIISYNDNNKISIIEFINRNIIIHNELLNLVCEKINKNFCNEIYELNKELNNILDVINNLPAVKNLNFKLVSFICNNNNETKNNEASEKVTWNEILFFVFVFTLILDLFSLYTNNLNSNFGIDFLTNFTEMHGIKGSVSNFENTILE